LVTTGADGRARVWRMEQLFPWIFLGPSAQVNTAHFDAGSQQIIVAIPGLEASPETYPLSGTPSRVESGGYSVSPYYWSTAMSPDRRWFAVGGTAGEVGIWDLASRRLVQRLHTAEGNVRCLAFSGDNLRLAAVAYDGSVFIWHAA
jgi:WD40 repeat protein